MLVRSNKGDTSGKSLTLFRTLCRKRGPGIATQANRIGQGRQSNLTSGANRQLREIPNPNRATPTPLFSITLDRKPGQKTLGSQEHREWRTLSDINKGGREGASRPDYTNGNGRTLDSSVNPGEEPKTPTYFFLYLRGQMGQAAYYFFICYQIWYQQGNYLGRRSDSCRRRWTQEIQTPPPSPPKSKNQPCQRA